MTDGEAVRRLIRAGWRVIRQRGSHVVLGAAASAWSPRSAASGKHALSPGQVAAVRRATEARL